MVKFEKPFISGNLMKNAEQLDEIVCEGHLAEDFLALYIQ